jgi:hypothetical protein
MVGGWAKRAEPYSPRRSSRDPLDLDCLRLARFRELARIPTKRRIVHGVAVSPDDRYAFVSVEGGTDFFKLQ